MATDICDNAEVVEFLVADNNKLHSLYRQGVATVLNLLQEDLTVPYIARYRKKETGGMEAENIRQIQQMYENYKKVRNKASSIIKKIGSEASNELIESLKQAKSVDEVQELYAPFKKGGKGTLAERARKIGLDMIALEILKSPKFKIVFSKHIKKNTEGLRSEAEIVTGIQHILADLIAKDVKVQDKVKATLCGNVSILTKASGKAEELDRGTKFSLYYKFQAYSHRLRSYQILAINRAEQMKVISVKLEIAKNTREYLLNWIKTLWIPEESTGENKQIISDAVEDSFKRLIEKAYLRRTRVRLTKEADYEAIDIFSHNLQQLLLVAPVKNNNVLSMDPGFKNGCKVAVIDKNGCLLDTAIIYPFIQRSKDIAKNTLLTLAKKHAVDVIALGNGTACRETECFISDIIENGEFKPLNVSYSIVNESGASIYSVTKDAKDEFGDLDPNLISAVSIGRRLQDPLLELVKIEAKHIGVGMYQHDVDETSLKAAVEAVIEDCVSFVGMDLNACSANMLRRVAGVSKKQAEAIVEYREQTGEFINRKELQAIKGIGKVTYRNCAGFVRIIPKRKMDENKNIKIEDEPTQIGKKRKQKSSVEPSKKKKVIKKANEYVIEFLDQTCIHPESYDIAYRVLDFLDSTPEMIGTDEMKKHINAQIRMNNITGLANGFETDEETLQLILDSFQQSLDFDLRADFEKPVFRTGLTSINQLKVKQLVTGVVRNNTSFGVFVDIGVVCDGLIHSSNLSRGIQLGPGDRVEVEVISIDVSRERIGLRMIEKTSNDILLK